MKPRVQSLPLARFSARKSAALAAFLFTALFLLGLLPPTAFGDTPEEIQAKINEQNAKIAELEKEIAAYEKQLVTIGSQKNTLQNTVNQLDVSRKKINANISVTQTKVNETTLQLTQLSGQIGDKETHLDRDKETIMKAFRTTYQLGDATLVEQLFAAGGFAEAWEHADNLERLQIALREQMEDLLATKEALTVDLNATQKKQNELAALKRELTGQKQVLDQNRAEQAKLLSDTKNQESAYQALLKSKQEAKEAFEKQLSDYEAQLKFNLDPTSIPKAGSGVLSFPIDPAFMNRCQSQKSVYGNIYCLTQYFGNTDFAKSGAYNGKGHNGVDFGTPTGTKIVAALSGRVVATGNTDAQKSCYSYGKWVLVEHGNGLSTLYAHLSVISVVAGDQLPTGGLIGYSGKTGYATGPHLHFTVYVSSAVKVVRYGDVVSKTNCGNVSMPVAPTEAYLNPMSYL
jgi:murein DD-endopeptidase MepM/ murein hydrolase activator NlpD